MCSALMQATAASVGAASVQSWCSTCGDSYLDPAKSELHGLTRGVRGDCDRRVLTLELGTIRLMGLVTTRGSDSFAGSTIGLVITASIPT